MAELGAVTLGLHASAIVLSARDVTASEGLAVGLLSRSLEVVGRIRFHWGCRTGGLNAFWLFASGPSQFPDT